MRFQPQPNDTIDLQQHTFRVAPHPAVPVMAFGQEARKSTVYKLVREDERQFALKVFKQAYRGPYLVEIARRIAPYANLPGMSACERTVLTGDICGHLIRRYDDMEYAVLMPWIAGRTWQDFILNKDPLPLDISFRLVESAIDVLGHLESRELAHCDISGGNVVVDVERGRIHLVDLEDMYGPRMRPPGACPQGTPGYQHSTSCEGPLGQWHAAGDRFSAAILLAELLAWSSETLVSAAYGEAYFAADEIQDPSCERYVQLVEVLRDISADISVLFERTWRSETLTACPSIAEWRDVVARANDARQVLSSFEEMILRQSGRQILSMWKKNEEVLGGIPESRRYLRLVEQAKQRYESPGTSERDVEPRGTARQGASPLSVVVFLIVSVMLATGFWLAGCLFGAYIMASW